MAEKAKGFELTGWEGTAATVGFGVGFPAFIITDGRLNSWRDRSGQVADLQDRVGSLQATLSADHPPLAAKRYIQGQIHQKNTVITALQRKDAHFSPGHEAVMDIGIGAGIAIGAAAVVAAFRYGNYRLNGPRGSSEAATET